MIRLRTLPLTIVVSVVAALAGLGLAAPAWARFVPMLIVLIALPGWGFSRHLDPKSRSSAVALTVATGVAWLVLTSQILLYTRWWKPAALIPVTLVASGLALMTPIRRPAHLLRRTTLRRLGAGIAVAATALFAGGQIWALQRLPYSAEELRPLQVAWMAYTQRKGGIRNLRTTPLSLLEAWLIPFHRPTFGTLLAARWLQFAFLLVALALAWVWAKALVPAGGHAMTWAILVSAALFLDVARTSPAAAVSAPFLLAGGWCLSRATRRPLLGGMLLGVAAVGSRTCALAAAGLLLWSWLDARERRHPVGPRWGTGLTGRTMAGGAATAASGFAVASRWGTGIPSLEGDPGTVGSNHGSAMLLWGGAFVITVFAGLWMSRAATANSSRSLSIGVRETPVFALAGSCAGAFLEHGPVGRNLSVPLLLLALTAAVRLWSSAGAKGDPSTQTPGLPASGRDPVRAATARVAITVLAVVVSAAIVGAGTSAYRNTAQRNRIAYILARTGPYDAVYDPTSILGIFRTHVDQNELGDAAFAIVDPSVLAGNPRLNAIIEQKFEPTPYPDVWRATLDWSEPELVFSGPWT